MRQILFGLIVLVPLLMSCEEDEPKIFQTDLSIEANQLFYTTSAMSESLFFAFYGWDTYQNLDSIVLPGCPEVLVNDSLKQVTLNFALSTTCELSEEYGRSGQIQLQYNRLSPATNSSVILKYNDYEFETYSLEGTRYFSQVDSANVLEIIDQVSLNAVGKALSIHLSGEMKHELRYENDSLRSISSTGEMQGVNPAGRGFEINLTSPKIQKMSCFRQNLMQPASGEETWQVQRGSNSKATYSVSYESTTDCETNAYARLPDGRKLLLNPTPSEE